METLEDGSLCCQQYNSLAPDPQPLKGEYFESLNELSAKMGELVPPLKN